MDALLTQLDHYLTASPLFALALAYLGGLLASLTPCIYPMIPITAGIIGHANVGGSRPRALFLSSVYVLGMALTYASLGFFAGATGRFFGEISTSPWTFLVVGNIILLFALWMLDVFQLPTASAAAFAQRSGIFGIFVAGISAALVAGPCTTPVLGALLAYTASAQNMVLGALLFFFFSLGLGTLLLVVGAFSGFLAALPRSGDWMVWMKKALGVLMLFTAQYCIFKAGTLYF
ncbi:MAG: cytochrome C biogenesis protein [Desulfobulbaceae bacterium]|nr:cytochrome C biogenesis protein [Desulfobulbaceae bacterium]